MAAKLGRSVFSLAIISATMVLSSFGLEEALATNKKTCFDIFSFSIPSLDSKKKESKTSKQPSTNKRTTKASETTDAQLTEGSDVVYEVARSLFDRLTEARVHAYDDLIDQEEYMSKRKKNDNDVNKAHLLYLKYDNLRNLTDKLADIIVKLESKKTLTSNDKQTLLNLIEKKLEDSPDTKSIAERKKISRSEQSKKTRSKSNKTNNTSRSKTISLSEQTDSLLDMLKDPKSEVFPHLRDGIASEWLSKHLGNAAVSILVGNQYESVTPQQEKMYLEAVKLAIDAGYYVLFDGDAKVATKIDKVAGKYGVALCARQSSLNKFKHSRSVVIENPYLRMLAFQDSEYVVTSRDSLTGLGLMIERSVDSVLDSENTWTDGVEKFADKAKDFHFGLGFSRLTPPKTESPESLFTTLTDLGPIGEPLLTPIKPFDLESAAKEINKHHSSNIIDFAENMVEGIRALTESDKGPRSGNIAGGAAMFGSSGSLDSFAQLTYEVAYELGRLGIPLATGGHGGAMRLGNMGAYDAGAHSFGITAGSSNFKLAKEGKFNTSDEYHTRTIDSLGYETRIPLMLHRRQIIATAPGGTGTLRELATALVSIANHSSKQWPLFMLIGKDYYEPLHKWLQDETSLPSVFKKSIKLIDSSGQVPKIVQDFSKGFSTTRLKTLKDKPGKPRHSLRVLK